ncbi:hypothetical protein ACF1GT_17840 [Streptomyces sp. NPDC014636]
MRVVAATVARPYGNGDHDADDPEVHQAGDMWSLSVYELHAV